MGKTRLTVCEIFSAILLTQSNDSATNRAQYRMDGRTDVGVGVLKTSLSAEGRKPLLYECRQTKANRRNVNDGCAVRTAWISPQFNGTLFSVRG
jgi:hypothetical protein